MGIESVALTLLRLEQEVVIRLLAKHLLIRFGEALSSPGDQDAHLFLRDREGLGVGKMVETVRCP